jgi:hypothetical protein
MTASGCTWAQLVAPTSLPQSDIAASTAATGGAHGPLEVPTSVSPVHPTVRWCGPGGWAEAPTEVSLSALDLPGGSEWLRLPPTVQIEGGSYTLDCARQLRDVLNGFLVLAAQDGARPVR